MTATAALVAGCPPNPEISLGRAPAGPRRVIPPPPPVSPSRDAGRPPPDDPIDAGLPPIDLSLAGMEDPPRQLFPGYERTLTLSVQGRGQAPSPTSSVKVWLVPDDPRTGAVEQEIGSAVVPSLGPDDQVEVQAQLSVPPMRLPMLPTYYRLQALVDPDDNLIELSEANNRLVSDRLIVSSVELAPRAIDFGLVGTGCRARRAFEIINRSDEEEGTTVRVHPPTIEPSAFALDLPDGPDTSVLPPGISLRVDVWFEPLTSGIHLSEITVPHTEFLSPMRLPVQGYSLKDPPRTDVHRQWTEPKIDILIVIDDARATADWQDAIVRQASTFFQSLLDRRMDFQLAVTTTRVTDDDGGRLRPPGVIGPSTPDGPHTFATMLAVDFSADHREQGMEAARRAISEPLRSQAHAGFLRRDASLAIIFISGRDDDSPANVGEYTLDFFASRAPGGSGRVVVNAIVPPQAGCPGAPAGDRYLDLARRTNGAVESICQLDWTTALRSFPEPGFGYRGRFPLARRPLNQTGIEVYVDGAFMPRRRSDGLLNWAYSSGPNEIVFDPWAVPEPGRVISIHYQSEC